MTRGWVGGTTVSVGMVDPLHHVSDQRWWTHLELTPGFANVPGWGLYTLSSAD